MTCSGCTESCPAHIVSRICETQRIWVYYALAYEPHRTAREETGEKLAILSKCFNDRMKTPGKKILVLPGIS